MFGNEQSWIWDYANGLGKSVSEVGPSEFQLSSVGSVLHLTCVIRTTQEAEAVREIIRLLAHGLKAHREMIDGDIYWEPPPPEETYAEKVARMFGSFEAKRPFERQILPSQRGGFSRKSQMLAQKGA